MLEKNHVLKTAAIVPPLVFFCVFLCFGSCVSAAKSSAVPPHAYLTDTSRFLLLPTRDIGKPIDMPQRISASFQGRDLSLLAWVKADESEIQVTLLNEMGTNIGELFYSDYSISLSSEVLPGSIKPEYIIADFQLCFYNAVLISKALKDCGLDMETSETTRRILKGNDVVYEIVMDSEWVRITNHLRGYTYTLEGDFS